MWKVYWFFRSWISFIWVWNLNKFVDFLIIILFNIIRIVRVEFLLIWVEPFNNFHKHIFQRAIRYSYIGKPKLLFDFVHGLEQSRNFISWRNFKDEITIEMFEQVCSRELFFHELNYLSAYMIQSVSFWDLMLNKRTYRFTNFLICSMPTLLLNTKMEWLLTYQLTLLSYRVDYYVITLTVGLF